MNSFEGRLPPPPNPYEWKSSKLKKSTESASAPKGKAEADLPIPKGGTVTKREQPIHEQFQFREVIPAFEIDGFDDLDVAVTMEKKNSNKEFDDEPNQDYFVADPKTGLIGVLDGLGGEGYGERASAAAAEALPTAYTDALKGSKTRSLENVFNAFIENQLERFKRADPEIISKIRKELESLTDPLLLKDPEILRKAEALAMAFNEASAAAKRADGKTTACVGLVHKTPDGERYAIIANTGDSGAFKQREDGELVPLTKEDSLLNVLRDLGRLSDELLNEMKAAPEKKFSVPGIPHPISYNRLRSTMVRALGDDDFSPAITVRKLGPKDKLIMASDGLIDVFENEETMETNFADLQIEIAQAHSPKEKADRLREAARMRADIKDDDIVALVAQPKI